MKLKFLLGFLLLTTLTFSQNGTVSGVISDKEYNNEPLPYANVIIKGTKKGVSTDFDGKYSISLEAGNYTLVIGYLGYETVEIPFTLAKGEKKVINYTLAASGVQLNDVVITHSVTKESEQALLQEQQKAVEIVQAIGAEEISKKGISDVAAAVAKTTGISKSEGSGSGGIFVRGLGDRYNMTTLNGLPLPSNNPSTKNISLDLFSTDIVEYIGIDKTYSYKNYGDFGGANININSKRYVGSGLLEIGTGFGVNSNAVSQDKFYLQDGPKFHGLNKVSIPNNPLGGYNFTTSWDKHAETPVNSSLFLRAGNSYSIGSNSKLSFFLNASFDNGFNFYEGIKRGNVTTQGIALQDLNKNVYSYQTSTNLMGNINYKINNNHTLKFNTMFINTSSQKHEEYRGELSLFDNTTGDRGFIRRSTFDRTTLLINQLLGEHSFGERSKLDWGISYNMLNNVIPDRMQNTFVPVDENDPNSIMTFSELNQSDSHRYYQDLTDDEIAGNLSFSYKFNKKEDDFKGKVIVGGSARSKEISFEATQFNFKIFPQTPGSEYPVDLNFIDNAFNQNNLNAGLFEIRTFRGNSSDSNALDPQTYGGTQDIVAGFGAVEYQFSPKLFVIAGVRTEMIKQFIDYNTSIKIGKNSFETIEVLPSLTAKYELKENQNLKLAASKTYTLPQFKERAPFLFEEIGQNYIGNPDLYNSTNYNLDLKWEFFPNKSEVISLTGYGKYIQNPINEITVASATNDISWANTGDNALGFGAELEVRKNIFSKENPTTSNNTVFSGGLNISYLKTTQELSNEKVSNETSMAVQFTNDKSALSGASDLLINADLSFNKDFTKNRSISTTLSASYFSDRIYALGVYGKGDLVDSSVVSLDYILKYKLNENLSFGLNAKNLLDPTIKRTQEDQNIIVDSFKKGRTFSFSMKYTF
ncbi:TonB-dependent receptor [Flavobacterium sp. J27]|uniref:TonB-dependent receptor n=1 Tax=Flavobacterium sp. J27 TaxID=2060419 RepID=UPI0010307060|nr:TonB-dependent receptor [Flavobacterium sp. J27]